MAGYGSGSGSSHRGWDDRGVGDYGPDDRRSDQRGFDDRGFDDRGYDQRGYAGRGYDDRDYDQHGYDGRGYDDRSFDDHDADDGRPSPRRGGQRVPEARNGRGARGAGPAGSRSGGRDPRRKGRSRARKILLYSVIGVLSLVLIAAGSGWYYYKHLTDNIKTFSTNGITNRPTEIQKDAFGGQPENILLIGSDSRAGDNSEVAGGDEPGARSDTSILLHIYGDRKHAVGVSIPRDTIVNIPACDLGNGRKSQPTLTKFNAAFATGNLPGGNPDCEIQTIEQWTGIRVDHAVIIDFAGFAAMTNAIGGVNVCVPANITEGDVNPNLGHAGKVLIPKGTSVSVSGQLALDYVRVRDGLGDGSDIGRTRRQQSFLSSLLRKMQSAGVTQLPSLLEAVTKSITVDQDLKSNLLTFAQNMSGINLHDVTFITMPATYDQKGTPGDPEGSGVSPTADANVLWQRIRDSQLLEDTSAPAPTTAAATTAASSAPPPQIAPATIRLEILNGTSTNGLAGSVSTRLKAEGYTVLGTGNGPHTAVTTIAYGPSGKAAAEQLQKEFPGSKLVAGSGSALTVTLGADQSGNSPTTPSGPSGSSGSSAASTLPTGITDNARTADQDLCSNITNGF